MQPVIVIGIIIVGVLILRSITGTRKRENSASRKCRHCGRDIPFTANVCPVCGHKPGSDWKSENRVYGGQILKELKWILLIVAAVAIYAGIKVLFSR